MMMEEIKVVEEIKDIEVADYDTCIMTEIGHDEEGRELCHYAYYLAGELVGEAEDIMHGCGIGYDTVPLWGVVA